MNHHNTRRRECRLRIVTGSAAVLATLAIVLGLGAPAAAGGWALGSLDALPDARPGETEQVGFTILQHGVTPVEVDGDVGLEIVGADGAITFFQAVPDGDVGHYVATIAFPAAGDYTWNIQMGWFPPQDLGSLNVAPASPTGHVALWGTARWGVLGVAAMLAGLAMADLVVGRRRGAAIS